METYEDLLNRTEGDIREQAKIYTKEPLTPYKTRINKAAGDLCVKNPSLLTQRGRLLQLSREEVDKSGYQYKKKQSRSKYFGTGSDESGSTKRPKYDKDMRQERMMSIKDELLDVNKSIDIKEKHLSLRVEQKRFDLCDAVQSEITELKTKRRELEAEQRVLLQKEKRAEYYWRKKSGYASSSDSEHTSHSSHSHYGYDFDSSVFRRPRRSSGRRSSSRVVRCRSAPPQRHNFPVSGDSLPCSSGSIPGHGLSGSLPCYSGSVPGPSGSFASSSPPSSIAGDDDTVILSSAEENF